MRFISVFASTLIFAASALGQQVPGSTAQASAAVVDRPPVHPITNEQVHELLELTGANRLKDQMIHDTLTRLQKAFPPYVPKDVFADLEASFAKLDVEPMTIKAYQKHISAEDAAQFIAFYETPAGRHLVDVLPLIAVEVQTSATVQAAQITREVLARHEGEIAAAAAAYRQQPQSDTPTITTQN